MKKGFPDWSEHYKANRLLAGAHGKPGKSLSFRDSETPGTESQHPQPVGSSEPTPGTICPTCRRRVNHPRQATSPESKVLAYRVPLDEVDAHKEILEAAGKHADVFELPYWKFKVYAEALVVLLQLPKEELPHAKVAP